VGEPTQRFQRRTVLVKRHLQLKYAAIVFAAVLFTAFIVGGGIYYSTFKFIKDLDPAKIPEILEIMKVDGVKIALFMGIMFLVSLFVSHKFAGPVFRFEQSAQVLATGDLTHRVCLRTGDDLMELQDEVNAMVASLQRLVQKDRARAESLIARLEALEGKAPEALRPELAAIAEELRGLTRGFKV